MINKLIKFLKENIPYTTALLLFIIGSILIVFLRINTNDIYHVIFYGGLWSLNFFCLGVMEGYYACYKRRKNE